MNEPAKPVRIDPELYELLSLEAKEQGRSITAQVNHTLKVAIVRGLTMPPLTEAQRIARKERFAKSRERGLAWRAKKDKGHTIRFNNPEDKE